MLLFSSNKCELLVTRNDDENLYLPRFVFSQRPNTSQLAMSELQRLLGVGDLILVAELALDAFENTHLLYNLRRFRLPILDAVCGKELELATLPAGMEWMSCSSFLHILEEDLDYEYCYQFEILILLQFFSDFSETALSRTMSMLAPETSSCLEMDQRFVVISR